jgi:ABC-type branched-subunit amino acid transport system substrate-binding protein
MKRVLLSLMLIALVVGIAVAGCAKPAPAPTPAPTPAPAPPKTLDIALLTPLTGGAADFGTNVQNAILLAMDDQNKGIMMAGGQKEEGGVTIAGEKYMLNPIIRDTKMDVVLGKNLAEEMVFKNGIKVIAGPFLGDAVGAQTVTEKNKVMLFASVADISGLCGPKKPYTFFVVSGAHSCTVGLSAYIQKFYPDLKTVLTMSPDSPALAVWVNTAQQIMPRYGLEWQGVEKFPLDTKDFAPFISRVLPKKPDIIDTGSTGGDMGALAALLVKQLREAGFSGVIMARTLPPPEVTMEVVPAKYLDKVCTGDVVMDSPVVSQAYKDMDQRYRQKFQTYTVTLNGMAYNGMKSFFEFLDGQNAMDTTAWMEGFAKHHWQGIWGTEAFWVGKPMFGIDRVLIMGFWSGEYKDGKPHTIWAAPVPWDIFVEE